VKRSIERRWTRRCAFGAKAGRRADERVTDFSANARVYDRRHGALLSDDLAREVTVPRELRWTLYRKA